MTTLAAHTAWVRLTVASMIEQAVKLLDVDEDDPVDADEQLQRIADAFVKLTHRPYVAPTTVDMFMKIAMDVWNLHDPDDQEAELQAALDRLFGTTPSTEGAS